MRKTRHRGSQKVGWTFTFTAAVLQLGQNEEPRRRCGDVEIDNAMKILPADWQAPRIRDNPLAWDPAPRPSHPMVLITDQSNEFFRTLLDDRTIFFRSTYEDFSKSPIVHGPSGQR